MIETIRQKLLAQADYERFEHVALRYMQLLLAAVTLFAMALVTIDLVRDFGLGEAFMEKEVLQDTFGSILIVLILLEFNHSVHLAVKHRTGAIQVRMVVLIAVLVIARKHDRRHAHAARLRRPAAGARRAVLADHAQ
jgi:uncharacterized membrane protein (DUF373 family)